MEPRKCLKARKVGTVSDNNFASRDIDIEKGMKIFFDRDAAHIKRYRPRHILVAVEKFPVRPEQVKIDSA
jgi:hypothetical protein